MQLGLVCCFPRVLMLSLQFQQVGPVAVGWWPLFPHFKECGVLAF